MRYATLATLLCLSLFGMSAPVAAEGKTLVVTDVQITGPASFNNAGSIITVTGTCDAAGYTYHIKFTRLVSGSPYMWTTKGPYYSAYNNFSKNVNLSSLGLQDDDELLIEVDVDYGDAYDAVTIPID